MAKSSKIPSINSPPFPKLKWADFTWEGVIKLPTWAGYQSRGGAYGARDRSKPSDGRVAFNALPANEKERSEPSAAQAKAFKLLVAKQKAIQKAMLAVLPKWYRATRRRWAVDLDPDELNEVMPRITRVEDFRQRMGLSEIHMFPTERDGIAYTGYEFGCTWDGEHGLGFMMHGARVVEVGGADTSILEWIAQRDARKRRRIATPK